MTPPSYNPLWDSPRPSGTGCPETLFMGGRGAQHGPLEGWKRGLYTVGVVEMDLIPKWTFEGIESSILGGICLQNEPLPKA